MELNEELIDAAVLALLQLGLHDGHRSWKGYDWDVMQRLHQKGYIDDPTGAAKSVVLTDKGMRESERQMTLLFTKGAA